VLIVLIEFNSATIITNQLIGQGLELYLEFGPLTCIFINPRVKKSLVNYIHPLTRRLKTSTKLLVLTLFIILVLNITLLVFFKQRTLSKKIPEVKEIIPEIKNLLNETNIQDLFERSQNMKKLLDIKLRESDKWWKEKRNFQNHPNLITIGIPTIERIKDGKVVNYLEITVVSLYNCLLEFKQIYPNSIHKIKILIQSSIPGKKHEIFDKLSKNNKFKGDFIFYSPKERLMDPHKDIPGHDYTHPHNEIPGKKARQQT
jgi:uncharacterized protein YhhL (DUF1145 family)